MTENVIDTIAILSRAGCKFRKMPQARKVIHVYSADKPLRSTLVYCLNFGFVLEEGSFSAGFMRFVKKTPVTAGTVMHNINECMRTFAEYCDRIYTSVASNALTYETFDESNLYMKFTGVNDDIFASLRRIVPGPIDMPNKQYVEEVFVPELRNPKVKESVLKELKDLEHIDVREMQTSNLLEYDVEHLCHMTEYVVYFTGPAFTTDLSTQCLNEIRTVKTLCIDGTSYMGRINRTWFTPYSASFVSDATMRERNLALRKIMPALKTLVFYEQHPTQLVVEDAIKDLHLVVYRQRELYRGTSLAICERMMSDYS